MVRSTDTVARLGGDEFAVLQTGIEGQGDAADLARRLIEATCRPVDLEDTEIQAAASIGITLYPTDGHDAESS